MAATKRFFLTSEHPVWTAQKENWRRYERLMRGGPEAVEDLIPFDWEDRSQDHYKMRQANAVYLNFPDRFASIMAGHLIRNHPQVGANLNFGTLGDVRRKRDIDEPTPAELFYYNTDGRGADGSEWRTFNLHVLKGAIATGHRWVLAEAPPKAPQNRGREIGGLRPYLSDFSPLAVKNWEYENGRLVMAIIHRKTRRLRVTTDGALEGNAGEKQILLLTSDGFTGFGPQFRNGGWYIFNEDHDLQRFGFYEATEGQIPLVPLYYERQKPSEGPPSISRSGVAEMCNAAVAYMNLSSAADFDAWDSATSAQAILGSDPDSFNLFIEKRNEGNRYAPLPPHPDTGESPTIQDTSTGAVVADVFDKRLRSKRDEAEQLMLNELEAAPYASGASKRVSFADAKEPRLAVMAAELSTYQNAIIHFVEQLWSNRPIRTQGSVEWPETFDLEQPIEQIKIFFDSLEVAKLHAPTAETRALLIMTRKLGISGDDETRNIIENELKQSAQDRTKAEEAEREQTLRPKPAVV